MKRINLLPEHLTRRPARQRKKLAVALVGAAIAFSISVWTFQTWTHLSRLDAQLVDLNRKLEPLRQVSQELQRVERHRQTLQLLGDPVPSGALLALLTQLTPDEVVLRTLIIDAPTPANWDGALVKESKNRIIEPMKPVHLELEGVTTTHGAISDALSRFSGSSVFDRVRLDDSHEGLLYGRSVHEFRLSMEIPVRPSALPEDSKRSVQQ